MTWPEAFCWAAVAASCAWVAVTFIRRAFDF